MSSSNRYKSRPVWQLLLLGFAAGAGGGLLGVGGGIIMIPVMTLWGLTQKCAQGTSLAVMAAAAPLAIFSYYSFGNVDFNFALPLAIGGLIGGEIGSRIACRLSNKALSNAFSVVLILVALRMILLKAPDPSTIHTIGNWDFIKGGFLGIFAGLAAGFFGVGGGIIFVPVGVLLVGLSQQVAQGSSWTAIFPTSVLCASAYRKQGELAADLARWLIPGALLGVLAGSKIADIFPSRELQIVFAIYLAYTGVSRLISQNYRRKSVGSCLDK